MGSLRPMIRLVYMGFLLLMAYYPYIQYFKANFFNLYSFDTNRTENPL